MECRMMALEVGTASIRESASIRFFIMMTEDVDGLFLPVI